MTPHPSNLYVFLLEILALNYGMSSGLHFSHEIQPHCTHVFIQECACVVGYVCPIGLYCVVGSGSLEGVRITRVRHLIQDVVRGDVYNKK